MLENLSKITFIQDRITAIVNDKLITGCWQCRYHIRNHEKDKPAIHWCEANKTGDEYMELDNLQTIPKECKYGVRAE